MEAHLPSLLISSDFFPPLLFFILCSENGREGRGLENRIMFLKGKSKGKFLSKQKQEQKV
jgi:hypothetical protein